MNVFGSGYRLGYGYEKVIGFGVEVVKGLEVDGAVGAGPARAGGVVWFEGEGGEVGAEGGVLDDGEVQVFGGGLMGGAGSFEEGFSVGGSLD